jgi:hypothetical protein
MVMRKKKSRVDVVPPIPGLVPPKPVEPVTVSNPFLIRTAVKSISNDNLGRKGDKQEGGNKLPVPFLYNFYPDLLMASDRQANHTILLI